MASRRTAWLLVVIGCGPLLTGCLAMPSAGDAPAPSPTSSSKPAAASSSQPGAASSSQPTRQVSSPTRVPDHTLRIVPGYHDGQATFRLAGHAATRYTLTLSGRGAAAPATATVTVLTDPAGVATASVPVTLSGDRVGGILADISSTVAGQQRMTSTSVWMHPDRNGTDVVGQSSVDAMLKATENDPAGRAAALAEAAAASPSEVSVTITPPGPASRSVLPRFPGRTRPQR